MSTGKDPLASKLNDTKNDPVAAELKKLMSHVEAQGTLLQKLASVREANPAGNVTPLTEPFEQELKRVWELVYTKCIERVFETPRGISGYYDQHSELLKQELQMCVIRADQAVENFIAVRNACPDPVMVMINKYRISRNPVTQ